MCCSITDFEYTVACAAFDMLDIALVHGWLLDDQDDATVRVWKKDFVLKRSWVTESVGCVGCCVAGR